MYTRILVPVDGSAPSDQALVEAIALAGHLKARMHLVHVVEPLLMVAPETMPATVHEVTENMRKLGAKLLQECESKAANAGVEVDTSLLDAPGGPAGEFIVKKADEVNADLIVCGTHGRRGLRRLVMGSDAEHIVRRASVPVLLVRKQAASEGE